MSIFEVTPEALRAAAAVDDGGSPLAVSTPWTARPKPRAMSTEKLAGWVERELDRSDRLLFTITPREELDEFGRLQQASDQVWVAQQRAIVAARARASDDRRDFAADELALALNVSPMTASTLSQVAVSLAALPGLLEAVSAGVLTQRHAMAVLRSLDAVEGLGVETRASIVLIALARYSGQTPGELGKLIDRLILLVDLDAAQKRQDKATKDRRVSCYPDVDGQGVVHARGPLEQVAAIKASLTQWRQDHPKADDDTRTESEREFDYFTSLLTGGLQAGSWQAAIIVPFTTADGGDLELADIDGFGPILPSTARELLEQADTISQIAIDTSGAVIAAGDPHPGPGHTPQPTGDPQPTDQAPAAEPDDQDQEADGDGDEDDDPGEGGGTCGGTGGGSGGGPGGGPGGPQQPGPSSSPDAGLLARPAPPAREAMDQDWFAAMRLLMTTPPPERLKPEQLGSAAYQTPGRLRRYLQARDRTCVFPGCHRRITDVDHRIPWPLGPTAHWNLQLLCRRHHRAKQAVFSVELTEDGDYLWVTRGGWQFERKRQGY